MQRVTVMAVIGILAGVAAVSAVEQDFFRAFRGDAAEGVAANAPYDGRLTFVRIRYDAGFAGFGRRGSRGELPWAHDYPTADTHVMRILNELTLARPQVDASSVFRLSDPDLHRYPIAYLSEPGFWMADEAEAAGLRSYLLKGGFIIFDDFRDADWPNLEAQMRRVLPDHHWVQLDASHPIFNAFFRIDDLQFLTSYSDSPSYWGLFEGNDRAGRLMAIANRDNDLGEYWEYSDTGYAPVDLSNQAYKFGVNYFVYALTH